MTTQTPKPVSGTARIVAVGLLSLAATSTWAQDASAQTTHAPKLMGHIEVTARPLSAAVREIPDAESVAMIGQMTVTATRLTTFAERNKQPASGGEPVARTRSPRAVLVQ